MATSKSTDKYLEERRELLLELQSLLRSPYTPKQLRESLITSQVDELLETQVILENSPTSRPRIQ